MAKKTSHAKALDAAAIAGDLYRLRQKLGIKEPKAVFLCRFRPIGHPNPTGWTEERFFHIRSDALLWAAKNNMILVSAEEVK